MISILLRIGLVRRRADGSVRWPVSINPWRMWVVQWRNTVERRSLVRGPFMAIGLFRNLPDVVKWEPGRLLPRRWGFFVFGIEIGDRG